MKTKEEKITVNRVYTAFRDGKSTALEEDETQTVEVRTFNDVPVATVNMVGALTKNLGNYDSAKVSVSVTVPTYLEEIDDAFQYAQGKVDEFLSPSLEEFVEILKEKGML